MLFRLIYASVASPDMTEADFRTIAMFSSIYNQAHNITGLLLTHNDQIMQVLEGPEDIVRGLFKKIKQDKRHTGVKLLSEGSCEISEFKSWSMGYRPLDEPVEMDMFFSLSAAALSNIMPDNAPTDLQKHIRNFAGKSGLDRSAE